MIRAAVTKPVPVSCPPEASIFCWALLASTSATIAGDDPADDEPDDRDDERRDRGPLGASARSRTRAP